MTPDEKPPITGDDTPQEVSDTVSDETERVDHTRPIEPRSAPLPESESKGRSVQPGSSRARQQARSSHTGHVPPDDPRFLAHGRGSRTGATASPVSRGQVPYAPAQRMSRRSFPANSGFYFPWWSLIILVGAVGFVSVAIFLLFTELSQPVVPGNQPARIQVVTSQPTLSQDFAQPGDNAFSTGLGLGSTPIPQTFPTATVPLPTPIPSPSLPPGDFKVGVEVKVVGVGSSGLNVRSSPGYEGTPRFLAAEDEVFVIVEGPQNVDGLEWWRIEDVADSARFGWAARNYLEVIS